MEGDDRVHFPRAGTELQGLPAPEAEPEDSRAARAHERLGAQGAQAGEDVFLDVQLGVTGGRLVARFLAAGTRRQRVEDVRRQPDAPGQRQGGARVGDVLLADPVARDHQHRAVRAFTATGPGELARLYVEDGQAALTLPLCRSLLRGEPLLEDVVRLLYRCHGQLGDAVSLKREHRRFLQALREAYDDDPDLAEPEPETAAVFEEVLAGLDAGGTMRPPGAVRPHRAA